MLERSHLSLSLSLCPSPSQHLCGKPLLPAFLHFSPFLTFSPFLPLSLFLTLPLLQPCCPSSPLPQLPHHSEMTTPPRGIKNFPLHLGTCLCLVSFSTPSISPRLRYPPTASPNLGTCCRYKDISFHTCLGFSRASSLQLLVLFIFILAWVQTNNTNNPHHSLGKLYLKRKIKLNNGGLSSFSAEVKIVIYLNSRNGFICTSFRGYRLLIRRI